jgi:hypothetical protein
MFQNEKDKAEKQEDHALCDKLSFDFFFYLVLDNVGNLLKIEKQKKLLEKLCIA